MPSLVGIDCGGTGALAFFDPDAGTLDIIDMPTVAVKRGASLKNEISPQMLAAIVRGRMPAFALVEKVGAMPGQGVSSMFQFGRGVGHVEGVLAALLIPTDYVTPQAWQKAVKLRDGPDGARARAAEMFPAYAHLFARKKDDGRADASLIAWFAAQK